MGETGEVVVEFLVEPFAEGRPGAHVLAAVDLLRDRGFVVEMGPFASTATGASEALTEALGPMVAAATAAGATHVHLQVTAAQSALRPRRLQEALAEMVQAIEREFGVVIDDWDRQQKQAAVRLLSERGAFLLRRSVEDVAEAMGVSRITIYNYLAAIEE